MRTLILVLLTAAQFSSPAEPGISEPGPVEISTTNATVADIEQFLWRLGNLSSADADVVSMMAQTADSAQDLFLLGRPAALLLASTINDDWESARASSEERAAMQLLREGLTRFYYDLAASSSRYEDGVNRQDWANPDLRRFRSEVLERVEARFDQLVTFLNPDENRVATAGKYQRKYHFMPKRISAHPLSWSVINLMIYFRENCVPPSKERIILFARAQAAFRLLEQRFGPAAQHSFDYTAIRRRILTFLPAMGARRVERILGNLANLTVGTRDEAVLAMRGWPAVDDLLKRTSASAAADPEAAQQPWTVRPDTCLLDQLNNAAEFDRAALYADLRELHRVFLRIEVFMFACTSVTSAKELLSGSPFEDDAEYARHAKKAADELGPIGAAVADWVRGLQNVTFPEIGIEAALNSIGDAPIAVESYDDVSGRVQQVFERIGAESDIYRVLVFADGQEANVTWSELSEQEYARFSLGGAQIHVFRTANLTSAEQEMDEEDLEAISDDN